MKQKCIGVLLADLHPQRTLSGKFCVLQLVNKQFATLYVERFACRQCPASIAIDDTWPEHPGFEAVLYLVLNQGAKTSANVLQMILQSSFQVMQN